MRIGIDARLIYYTQAGIRNYIVHLIAALARIEQEDEFVILQSRKDDTILVHQPNFHRRSFWTPSHHRLEQWTLPLELSPLRLDVLHSPDFIPPLRRNCRSIITVHDLTFLLYPHFLTQESARYYGQIDEAVQHADHIIAVSQSTKRDAARLLGVPENKVTVIYEAADPIFRPLPDREMVQRFRKERGLEDDYLLFVSTIEPRKNLPLLLRAYHWLRRSYKGRLKLVVVGSKGWLFDEVFLFAERLDLQEEVIFTGWVPAEELVFYYNGASCLVHPSFYEGFGLTPLEAMACGTPVVTSNTSSLPEVVGDAGLMVDPEDVAGLAEAIRRLLEDASLRNTLVEKGLERAKLFSWERAAGETLKLYRRVGSGG